MPFQWRIFFCHPYRADYDPAQVSYAESDTSSNRSNENSAWSRVRSGPNVRTEFENS